MKNIQTALRIPNPEDFTDQATAVKITGLSRSTLNQMVTDGRLKAYLIGSHRVYWVEDIVAIANALKLIRGGENRPE